MAAVQSTPTDEIHFAFYYANNAMSRTQLCVVRVFMCKLLRASTYYYWFVHTRTPHTLIPYTNTWLFCILTTSLYYRFSLS